MSRFRPWLAPLIALGFALLLFAGYKGLRLWQVHTLFEPENIVENFRTMSQLFGFYPISTDGLKRAENFKSCRATLRRIRGL